MKFIEDVAGIRVDSKWLDRTCVHAAKTKEEAVEVFVEYLEEGLDEILRNIKSDYLDSQLAHRSFGSLDLAKRNNQLAEKLDKLEKHLGILGRELRDKDAHISWLEKRIAQLGGKT
jgi:predicted oxidoreductase